MVSLRVCSVFSAPRGKSKYFLLGSCIFFSFLIYFREQRKISAKFALKDAELAQNEIGELDFHSSLEWLSPCMYKARNFCVIPGADEGVFLFTKSGKLKSLNKEIPHVTKLGILMCSEGGFGFLNVQLGEINPHHTELFEKHLIDRVGHLVNSAVATNPTHLLYTFIPTFNVSSGASNFDLHFTLGGSRQKIHMSESNLEKFTAGFQREEVYNLKFIERTEKGEKVMNISNIFASVFPNFYYKDDPKHSQIRCYKNGVIGKPLGTSGETFLPPFVKMSADRKQFLVNLKKKISLPFQLNNLDNVIDQSAGILYQRAILDKLKLQTKEKVNIRKFSIFFALRRHDRKILNIELLIQRAQELGLHVNTAFMDDLEVEQQISRARTADIIAGPEGSNLWIAFWQQPQKVLILFQNPSACIARCEWSTTLSDGKHSLVYEGNTRGVYSRIAWWAKVYTIVVDSQKCLTGFTLKSAESRLRAHVKSGTQRRSSYSVNVNNFVEALKLALEKLEAI